MGTFSYKNLKFGKPAELAQKVLIFQSCPSIFLVNSCRCALSFKIFVRFWAISSQHEVSYEHFLKNRFGHNLDFFWTLIAMRGSMMLVDT